MNKLNHLLIVGLILAFLVACTPNGYSNSQRVTPTTGVSITQATLTLTDIPIVSTSTSAPLNTSTPSPKPTALPTLPAEQAKAKTLELLNTNNGCKLPCWWGLTPGYTSWNEAKNFLSPFAFQVSAGDFPESPSFEGAFYFPLDNSGVTYLHLSLTIRNNLIQEIRVGDFDVPSYHLAEFLSANGKPDQTWLLTFSEDWYTGKRVLFLLYLYYEDARMLVAYGMGEGHVEGDWINGCITDSPSLYMWTSEKKLSFLEAGQLVRLISPKDKLLNITDATQGKLDDEMFYQKFKDKNVKACFRTPKDLWPKN